MVKVQRSEHESFVVKVTVIENISVKTSIAVVAIEFKRACISSTHIHTTYTEEHSK